MHWFCFIVGQVVNVFRQANLVAGSDPTKNPINSSFRWVYRNLVGLAVREVFAVTAFWLMLNTNLGALAITKIAGAEYVPNIPLAQIPIIGLPFGIMFSIGSDYLIEKWGWLKSHMIPLGQ